MMVGDGQQQERRLGWGSYALMAIVAGVAAGRFRKQLRRNPFAQAGEQQEFRWASREAELWQEHMDEIERQERVKQVQSVFQRERSNYRNRHRTTYEKWEEHPPKVDESKVKKEKEKFELERAERVERARLRHHYIVLGLNPFREGPFTEDEIKAAFRERALQYHPDKNPGSKAEETRAKFRELMDSYNAIKLEKNIC